VAQSLPQVLAAMCACIHSVEKVVDFGLSKQIAKSARKNYANAASDTQFLRNIYGESHRVIQFLDEFMEGTP
jgi:hypothetical protein